MRLNTATHRPTIRTAEGATASHINPEQQLRRLVLSCLLWEDGFYTDGIAISEAIEQAVSRCSVSTVATIAREARTAGKLRHVPLYLARLMAKLPSYRGMVADVLADVIQRPDELAEFLAIYWKNGREPLSAGVKKGLARAFQKFNEYQLAKYNRDGAIKLRDVLFLTHAKPIDEGQADVWRRLVAGELATPDTWEVALSGGANKKETFERLIAERKLGGLALLRNLRNMRDAGIAPAIVSAALQEMRTDRILPFRFIAAARAVPDWEPLIEPPMLQCAESLAKLPGRTVLLVDVSGSMDERISSRSDMDRIDAGCGLAILLREICEEVTIYTFSDELVKVPLRRGFALRDAISNSQDHGGTLLGRAVYEVNLQERYDRLIVITDEQSHDEVSAGTAKGYIINVASERNGVAYDRFVHVTGWSESVIDFIGELEKESSR